MIGWLCNGGQFRCSRGVGIIILVVVWQLINTPQQSNTQEQDWSWLREDKSTTNKNDVRSEGLALKAEYDRTNRYSYHPQNTGAQTRNPRIRGSIHRRM